MANFFEKPWVAFVLPFLCILCFSEATFFMPHWRFRLLIGAGLIGMALLFLWRAKLFSDIKSAALNYNLLTGTSAGVLIFAQWYALVSLELLHPQKINLFARWEGIRAYIIIAVIAITFIIIIPIINELFWRSFLLRYFITQEFKSVPVGSFNLLAMVMVVILSSLPTSNFTLHLIGANIILTSLVVWRKNIYCCIIAHALANAGIFFVSMFNQISFY